MSLGDQLSRPAWAEEFQELKKSHVSSPVPGAMLTPLLDRFTLGVCVEPPSCLLPPFFSSLLLTRLQGSPIPKEGPEFLQIITHISRASLWSSSMCITPFHPHPAWEKRPVIVAIL